MRMCWFRVLSYSSLVEDISSHTVTRGSELDEECAEGKQGLLTRDGWGQDIPPQGGGVSAGTSRVSLTEPGASVHGWGLGPVTTEGASVQGWWPAGEVGDVEPSAEVATRGFQPGTARWWGWRLHGAKACKWS